MPRIVHRLRAASTCPARAIRSPTAHPWYVLLEISGLKADGTAERLLTERAGGGHRARAASSMRRSPARWPRRATSGACASPISEAQKPEGGSIKHDVSVPVQRIPEFIARADALVERICPGARPLPFGHFGDGNVHYNIAQPVGMAQGRFLALWDEIVARRARRSCVEHGRLDLGRARHRPHEARRAGAREERRSSST